MIKAQNTLTTGLNRSPTLTEIDDHLGVSEEQVAEPLEAIDTRRHLSLGRPVDEDGEVSFGALLPPRRARSSSRTG